MVHAATGHHHRLRPGGVSDGATSERIPFASIAAIVAGAFMVSLDQTIVSIALPRIGRDLDAATGVDWVMSAYLLALGAVQPTMGWLADRLGRKRVFLASLVVFTVGSSLAAFAADLPQLVAARIVQGIGGGAIFPVGMAMIYEQVSPSRRGTAIGAFSLGIATAPALGPTVGGLIITEASWRWLFLIMVPISVVAIAVGWRVLSDAGFRERRRFDGVGFGLITVGLTAVLYAVGEGNQSGFDAPSTLALLASGVVLMVAFIFHELRHPEPLIDVRMFAIPAYRVAMALTAGMIAMMFARFVFIPLELVNVRGLSELEVGLILTPAAFTQAAAAPIGGMLSDRIGARPPVVVGLIAMALAAIALANLSLDTPTILVAAAVAFQSLGNGLALTPNAVAGMNSLPQRLLARGTAIRSTTRQVASSFAVAFFGAFLVSRIGSLAPPTTREEALAQQAAYNALFLIVAVLALVCLVLAIRGVPDSEETVANVEARSRERAGATPAD
jgi:EmrB/QacA subfamily drug resistance transporter